MQEGELVHQQTTREAGTENLLTHRLEEVHSMPTWATWEGQGRVQITKGRTEAWGEHKPLLGSLGGALWGSLARAMWVHSNQVPNQVSLVFLAHRMGL